MSDRNPIPKRLREKFFAAMDAANDDDLPDGAWWAVLEETAQAFMDRHGLRGCPNSATHQWNEARSGK